MRKVLIAALFVFDACAAIAQSPTMLPTPNTPSSANTPPAPNMVTSVVGPAPADRAVSPGSSIEVQATTDASSATIKLSTKPTGPHFTTWQTVASAPLSKGGNATNIVTAQGFPDSFTLTAKLSSYNLPALLPSVVLSQKTIDEAASICADVIAGAKAQNVSDDAVKKLMCSKDGFDLGEVGKYAKQDLDRSAAMLFKAGKPDTMWGATATAGYRSFNYIQSTGGKATASRTPLGASVFFGLIPAPTLILFTGGAEYRRNYKDADSGAICLPSSTQCKTGPVGTPTRNEQKIAYLEVRRLMGKHAVSLKTAYDSASHHWSGDLPVYLITTDKGALAGGVRASWEQTKKLQLGVFVSTFSLFPF